MNIKGKLDFRKRKIYLEISFIFSLLIVFFIINENCAYAKKENISISSSLALSENETSKAFIDENKKKILFISSYNLNLDSVIDQISGFKKKVNDDNTIYYYFMDTKRVPEEIAAKKLSEEIESNYGKSIKKAPYDVIIASDDAAFNYVIKNKDKYFKDLPIIFMGVNNVKKAFEIGNENPNINGIVEAYPIVETLKLALKFYPNATQIVGIVDNSLTGRASENVFVNCANKFPNQKLKLLNISNYTKEDVLNKIKEYDENTILIYLIATDFKNNKKMTLNQTMKLFSEKAKIPIFRPNETGIGYGALGGQVMFFEKMGEKAGIRAQAIINNLEYKTFPVIKAQQYILFDEKVMKKFNINKKLLPKETIYINKELNIFEKHDGLFEDVILIIVSIFGLLLFFVYDNRQKKKKVDFEKKANHKMNQNIDKLEAAMNSANLFYSNYDIKTHELEVGKNMQAILNVPRVTLNYPDSWVKKGIISKNEGTNFKRMVDNFKKNKPEDNYKVSFVQKYKIKSKKEFSYQQVDCIGIYDLKGNLNQIFETRIDITDQVEAERRYQKQIEDFSTFTPNTIISFRFNLEKGIYQSSRTKISDPDYFELNNVGNITELFGLLNNLNECKFENNGEIVTFEKIKKLFEEGKEGFNFYCKSKFNKNKVKWIKGYSRFSVHPRSKEKEVLIQLVKNTKNHLHKEALNKITENTYESVFLVYGENKKFELLAGNAFLDEKYSNGKGEFNKEVFYSIQKGYLPKEKEEYEEIFECENIIKKLAKNGHYNITVGFYNKNNVERKKNIIFSIIDEEEKIFTVLVQDVTEVFENERKMNNELKNALIKAKKANMAKSDFLALMSHDIRTPMNAILTLAELGEEENLSKQAAKEYFKNISDSGRYLLSLLTDILDISKLDNNKMKLEPSVVKGEELIDEIRNIFEKQVKLKNISFSIDVEKPELLEEPLYIDSVKLKQIMVNLISNSYKFTPPGGSIKVNFYDMKVVSEKFKKPSFAKINNCQEFCEKVYLHYKISVEDTGIGMSKEFLPKLFNPFEQEAQSYKTELAGTGLGTTIIKKLVDLMGGSIKVKSEVGKGTIFELQLVAELLSEDGLKKKEVNSEIDCDKIDFSNLKILLVEDNKVNEIVAKKILRKKDVSLVWAKNGYEAIEYLLESEPFTYDAILMDIRMPGIDGWETTKKIRAIKRKDIATIPIIAMTANVFEEEVKKSSAVGMNEHLSKPINTKKLFKVLSKYCKVQE